MLRPFTGALFLLLCQSAAAQWGQSGVKVPKQSDEKSAEAQQPAYVNCDGLQELTVFQRPGDLTSKVAALSCGERVTRLDSSGGWVKVRTAKGLEGYVSDLFISLKKPSSSPQPPAQAQTSPSVKLRKAKVQCNGLRYYRYRTLFAAPNSVESVSEVKCGTKLAVLGFVAGQWHVLVGGKEGYLPADAIESAEQVRERRQQHWNHLANTIKAAGDSYAKAAMGPEQRKCYQRLEYRIAELRAQGATEQQLAEVRKKGKVVCSHPPEQRTNTNCVPFDPQRGYLFVRLDLALNDHATPCRF